MYNKHNIDVAKIASKTSIKPELGSVAFFGNRTIATDSFRLLEVTADGEAHDPKMLPAKELARTVKLKKNETVELDRVEQIMEVTPNPHWVYPDIDQILKSTEANEEYVEVKVNGKYLAELATLISKISDHEAVTLRVPKEQHKAILMYSVHTRKRDDEPQKARGLLMPMNK